MSSHRNNQILREPDNVANTTGVHGWHKAIVEDVRDPMHMGRIKARAYATHGDYNEVATEDLPWAEGMFPTRGGYQMPEMFDRVWLTFENGNPERPIWFGYWFATPDGSGKLPFNREKGLETPRETWHYHPDHHPTTMSLFKTGEGDQLWVEDRPFSPDYMISSMNMADAGNKFLKMSTRNQGKDYRPEGEKIKGEWGEVNRRRERPSERTSSVTKEGEMRLEAGSFRLHNICDSEDQAVSRMTLDGTRGRSSVDMEDGRWLAQEASQRAEINRTLLTDKSLTLHSQGRLVMNGRRQQLPEVW